VTEKGLVAETLIEAVISTNISEVEVDSTAPVLKEQMPASIQQLSSSEVAGGKAKGKQVFPRVGAVLLASGATVSSKDGNELIKPRRKSVAVVVDSDSRCVLIEF
jgi:hypothetical protein